MAEILGSPKVLTLVPDVFPSFSCKGGACRHTCCQGWRVSLPMKEYFALLNLPCDPSFQAKVSRSLRLSLTPTPQSYAEFAQTYEGRCPLLLEDGWCGLHKQCGEAALPTVCRQYPRIHRSRFGPEASLANSCERTLELLFEKDRPLTFRLEWIDASRFSAEASQIPAEETVSQRMAALNHLSDRTYPFSKRLESLQACFPAVASASKKDTSNVAVQTGFDLSKVLHILRNLLLRFSQSSPQLEELAGQSAWRLDDSEAQRQYAFAKTHLDAILPNHPIWFEKMIVHHLFSRSYPFLEDLKDPRDAEIALIGTHAFLRYFALTVMTDKQTMIEFVDLMARLFRVIAHTRFEAKMLAYLREANAEDPITLRMLCAF